MIPVIPTISSFGIRARPLRSLWRSSLKSILELSWHLLHVTHTAGTGGLSSLRFHAPVVL